MADGDAGALAHPERVGRHSTSLGWFSAWSIDARLDSIVEQARNDRIFFEELTSVHCGAVSISPTVLSKAISLPISSREYPDNFRDAIAELAGAKLRCRKKYGQQDRAWSQSSFKLCFSGLNRLAYLPAEVDRLEFEPFPNSREHARRSGANPDRRTANLPLEDAAKILQCALNWIYRRSDGVIELVTIWRDAIQEAQRSDCAYTSMIILTNNRLQATYPELCERYDLPKSEHVLATTVLELVQRMQTAAMLLVGINQARRKNEVLGEGKRPFGLYRGCLTLSDPFVEASELDIYIEKTWRNWLRMSTNKLTVDAIGVLEKLHAVMFPELQPCKEMTREELRRQKLFVLPSHKFFIKQSAEPDRYDFDRHGNAFFEEAQVAEQYRRTHQMRRLFALIYMYRWDHPVLQALSEHLCHVDIESTRLYVTDDEMRKEAERIEALYRVRTDGFPEEEIGEARRQYQDDQLRAMLSSTASGGPMTYRVRKWVRRLAHTVQFADDELEGMVAIAQQSTQRKGYEPRSFRHGICWAGAGRGAARKARCGDGAALHRERAGIGLCGSCPFHSTSAIFLKNIEQDAEALDQAADAALDPREKIQCRRSARELRDLIKLEHALMARHLPPARSAAKGAVA